MENRAMPIKTIITDLSEAHEALQSEYQEKDIGGKTVFVLNLEGVDDHPAIANLKNAYERVKADKQKLAADLKEIQGKAQNVPDDFDPDEWARMKAEDERRSSDPDGKDVRAQIDAATGAVKAQYEARIARIQKDADAKLAERDKAINDLDGEVRSRLVGDGLKSALAAVGVRKGLIDAATAKFGPDVEVVVEDGRRVARMKADLGGDEIERYIANWAQSEAAKDFIAPPTGDDETGSRNARAIDGNPFAKKSWNKTDQGRLFNADRAKAERAAKQAGFKTIDQALASRAPIE